MWYLHVAMSGALGNELKPSDVQVTIIRSYYFSVPFFSDAGLRNTSRAKW